VGDSYSVARYAAIIMAFGERSPREHFEKNIRSAGLSDWVEVHQGTAEEIATAWTTAIDLLIFDGDQSPAGVQAASEGWSPWLKLGGVIALHNSGPGEYGAEHEGHFLVATDEIQPPRYIGRQLVGSISFAGRPPRARRKCPWIEHRRDLRTRACLLFLALTRQACGTVQTNV
jgi:hypothetical protein